MSTKRSWASHGVNGTGEGGNTSPAPGLKDLWAWTSTWQDCTVVLHFEDSLASFVTSSPGPRLTPALRRALSRVSDVDHVVIVSGCGVDQIGRHLRGLRVHVIGEHGWEWRTAEGRKVAHQLPSRAQHRLDMAAHTAGARGWRPLLVRRRCSLLLRPLPTGESELIRRLAEQLWSPRFETDGLRLHSTSEGVELRAAEHDTESALKEVTRQCGASPRFLVPVGAGAPPLTRVVRRDGSPG